MKKLLLLKGLPASGKTTYAKELTNQGWLRVNKDDLRAMLHNGKWSKHNEEVVLTLRNSIIMEGLMRGASIVVDDTNLHPKHEKHIRGMVDEWNEAMDAFVDKYVFEVKFFDTPLAECIERDRHRLINVGEKVIRRMHREFLYKKPEMPPILGDKPWAIICDIDGTLAKMGHRSPYEWKLVGRDQPVREVAHVLEVYRKHYEANDEGVKLKIILVSGRDSVCRPETEQWLNDYNIKYDKLFMRSEGDNRKDAIVKGEIYEEEILGNYNVEFVLDDRNQVVEMWRERGLTVFQVAEGDF